MNIFLCLVVLVIIIIVMGKRNRKDGNKETPPKKSIEAFNNYTILYMLGIVHDILEKDKFWYILIGDTLDSIIVNNDLPVFGDTGYILVRKEDEQAIIGLKDTFKKAGLYMHINLSSLEIKTNFNKNISIMIYLVNNNNGMLDICSTKDQLECKSKCCKVDGSNIDYSKFTISYSDANPRLLYKAKDIELYGPNKYKKVKSGCNNNPSILPKQSFKNNNKHQLLLNEYVSQLSGKVNDVLSSQKINTRNMYKITGLNQVVGYNNFRY